MYRLIAIKAMGNSNYIPKKKLERFDYTTNHGPMRIYASSNREADSKLSKRKWGQKLEVQVWPPKE